MEIPWGVGSGGFFLFVVHPLFHPLPGATHFLCLAKESKQRKVSRPRQGTIQGMHHQQQNQTTNPQKPY
jgi:hypothetical protein